MRRARHSTAIARLGPGTSTGPLTELGGSSRGFLSGDGVSAGNKCDE